MKSRNLICLVALLLSGCAYYTLVDTERQKMSDIYSVDPQINWSRSKETTVEIWTVDGPLLQAIRFFDGIADGDGLFPSTDPNKKFPLFRADMAATEIQELVVDTIANMGGGNVQASNLRPFKFGALPGFRFEVEFLSDEGLELEGLVAGATHKERLYLIVYSDTRDNRTIIHKVATTPDDPSQGVMRAIEELCDHYGVAKDAIDHVYHGTTIATNAVLEHKGARTGMVTTKGYRDIIHIGRH